MDIDSALQSLAQKALASSDPSTSAVFRIVILGVFFIYLWFLQWQVAAKERELAKAQATVDHMKAQAAYDAIKSQEATLDREAQLILGQAFTDADAASALVAQQQTALAAQKEKLAKVARWEDLNAIAGVKP